MNFKQTLSIMVVLLMATTACLCFVPEDSSAAYPYGEHVSTRDKFSITDDRFYSDYYEYYGYGTGLNPYSEVEFFMDQAETKCDYSIYVIEGAPLTVHTGAKSSYHSSLVREGWTYTDGTYEACYDFGMSFPVYLSSSRISVSFYGVEKPGWLTAKVQYYGFNLSTPSEPLLGVQLDSPKLFSEFAYELYLAEGGSFSVSIFKIDSFCEWECDFDGDFLYLMDRYNQHFVCDSLPLAEGSLLIYYTDEIYYEDHSTSVDLHVVEYTESSELRIISEPADSYCVIGTSFSYDVVTNIPGTSVTVEGPAWLTVSGTNHVGGTPIDTEPGTYHVKITATVGSLTDVQEFDIIVVERLDFTTIPTGGILAYPSSEAMS